MTNNEIQGRVINSPSANAHINMAIDQALFESFKENDGEQILRFYTFNSKAITYGYFQDIDPDDYANREHSRRLTGGGVVLHGKDIVITFIFKPQKFDLRGTDQKERIYYKLKKTIIDGLCNLGIDPSGFQNGFNYEKETSPKYECFEKIVKNDVVYNDKKLMGFALRRTKYGVMVQSSLRIWRGEPDNSISLEEISDRRINLSRIVETITGSFSKLWNIDFVSGDLTEPELTFARDLTKKYSSDEWNYNRQTVN